MKKMIMTILISILLLFVVGCDKFSDIGLTDDTQDKEWQPLLDAMINMDLQESYYMNVEMLLDGTSLASIEYTVVGNYIEYPVSAHYTAKMVYEENQWYLIGNCVGMPMLDPLETQDIDIDMTNFDELVEETFTFKDGYYVSDNQDDGITKFKVENNLVTEIVTEVVVEETVLETIITFRDFNAVSAEIPFYITLEQEDYMYEIMESTTLYPGGSSVDYLMFYDNTGNLDINCNPQTKVCLIDYTTFYIYYPETQTIGSEDAPVPVSTLIDADPNDIFTDRFFELIDYMFDLHQQTIESGYYE